MNLTEDQQKAMDKIKEFLEDPAATSFLLEGGAGVGKTFLLGHLLSNVPDRVLRCVAAPTHKAINVLRRKLDSFDLSWCQGYDDYSYNGVDVITGTTAQLLGIRPVIAEDQGTELKFGRAGRGILEKIMPPLNVVDEVSMLGWRDFKELHNTFHRGGCKLIAVGDAGQLPPVKQEAIPFDKFKHRATLRQIVRQAEGSAIITLAWAIRDGKDWESIAGSGIRRASSLSDAFLEVVQAPGAMAEEERSVFIAYTNRVVNEMQDRACGKVYGHTRLAFDRDELVLAERNYYAGKTLLCANQDELIVDSFDLENKNDIGTPVTLHRKGRGGRFTSLYVEPDDLRNQEHPYNVELRAREKLAQDLQSEMKKLSRGSFGWQDLDDRRRIAWRDFFEWRDQTIITFRHPFAITSHKSQGSTYRRVFADVGDLGRFSTQALYVAVTRPKEELILPGV